MDQPKQTPSFEKKGRKYPKFDHRKKFQYKVKKSQVVEEEIARIQEQCANITDKTKLINFDDFPLCENTKKGLRMAKYTTPTEIQSESLIHALLGNDILGAAKTGSGKTLAFLIPVLEVLFKNKWNQEAGLGALVITPTRELAYQIFEVLKKIGKHHDFSAGLVIGGKNLEEEAQSIAVTNIVICTPGRLLQHMDETAFFNADNLQMLVLDEADRCLDLGFQQTMNAILENLPEQRQTLLFSATQTKSVKDLARLSLKDPIYVSVHEHAQHCTPNQLQQSYVVCELHEKINMLWSFIQNHRSSKILVFIQSCKQVRFIHEVFLRLLPGAPILALHGAMKQLKRIAMYDAFCRKQHAVLFATDIAARGLDFPAVNWVVQFDCPEDANTYIHRAGRTARYEEDGEALLVLLPSEEEAMVVRLTEKKIPITKIKVNSKKLWSIQSRIESLCAAEFELKEFAQRSFVSYLKSVFLMKDKKVFDVSKLDTDAYAQSLGLAIPPRVRFLAKQTKFAEKHKKPTKSTQELINKLTSTTEVQSHPMKDSTLPDSGNESDANSDSQDSCSLNVNEKGKHVKDLSRKPSNPDVTGGGCAENNAAGSFGFDIGNEDFSEIFTVKKIAKVDEFRKDPSENSTELPTGKKKVLSKKEKAKRTLNKKIQLNTKVAFDEEGEEIYNPLKGKKTVVESDSDEGGLDLEAALERMKEQDKFDKELHRQRIKAKHKEKKLKEKEARGHLKKREDEDDGDETAVLGYQESSASALDFIPDPDEIYGPEEDSDQSNEFSEQESDTDRDSSDEDYDGPPKKKTRHGGELESEELESDGEDENTEDESDSDEDMTQGLSISDQEALALKLLE